MLETEDTVQVDESEHVSLLEKPWDKDNNRSNNADAYWEPSSFSESVYLISSSLLFPLFLFLPFSFLSHFLEWPAALTFLLCTLSLAPTSALLGIATEHLAEYTSNSTSAFLNVSFGNAPEVIFAATALLRGYDALVVVTLLGSVVSNLLLVLGLSFLCARPHPMPFNPSSAVSSCRLLLLAAIATVLPAVLNSDGQWKNGHSQLDLTRYFSVVLVLSYIAFTVYQMTSDRQPPQSDDIEVSSPSVNRKTMPAVWVFWMGLSTLLLAFLSEFLVQALSPATTSLSISNIFTGFFILPLANNVPEHACAIDFSRRGKLELSLEISLSSSTQLFLCCIPTLVLFCWGAGLDFSLNLDLMDCCVVIMSTLLVMAVVSDGHSDYIKGTLLISAYSMICAAYFFHRDFAL